MATPRKPDQGEPRPAGPSGQGRRGSADREQSGTKLTTAGGVRLPDTNHSLKAGERGPTLMEDFHFREKITHFDHERIPERVVHARGAAAHGVFTANGAGAGLSRAAFLQKGTETEVFTRFSTVVGSRGSADTARDVRGFAVKFYTSEGNFDLVGNNIPVFFIQDAIKFPDLVHAVKPHPGREIPQAQSAHDSFWDFASLHTETTHMLMWVMSDRGIPRSYRTMEGFGVHTFRLVDAEGGSVLVKFHWKPAAGVHSLVWEEAQIAAGADPDLHRRDLADAIEAGAFPSWDLGVQVFEDTEDQFFEDIDLLDPTKLVPEELAPVQVIGTMTLNANPTNYFAETEQVAFHTGHLVPGIEVTDDPLLQGRMFSYLDTQLSRLGGANFNQLPINRPQAPVNDMLRDGMHQTAIHRGVAPYHRNTLDGGQPKPATEREGAYITKGHHVEGDKVRTSPASFEDHYSQATLFWESMTEIEQAHIVEAFTFELGKCFEQSIRERTLASLAQVSERLCAEVAAGLGLPAPDGDPTEPTTLSPALSLVIDAPGPIDGRKVGVILAEGGDLAGVAKLREAVEKAGAVLHVISARGGDLSKGNRTEIIERTFLTTRSIEFDAVVVADGSGDIRDVRVDVLLQETYRHCKAIAAWGDGQDLLTAAGIDVEAPGVLVSAGATVAHRKALLKAIGLHRAWDRAERIMRGSNA